MKEKCAMRKKNTKKNATYFASSRANAFIFESVGVLKEKLREIIPLPLNKIFLSHIFFARHSSKARALKFGDFLVVYFFFPFSSPTIKILFCEGNEKLADDLLLALFFGM